ncbi:type IV secretion system protein TraC [Hydrogenovibrio marinus]|uniref:TraG P-loop domain-containing protein n=1 Tax=Hydrogenovibrio marinus TaxID=28885 RepID=A0A066ZXC4_HYDMR|nr:type IV secretion system protein TraC [Hydrogenovibrio marinus]KDN94725.1 hypothetical protein EI16_12580 [Hydrogenovibrio marinus]
MLDRFLPPEVIEHAKTYSKEIVDSLKTSLGVDDDAVVRDIFEKSIHADSISTLLPYLGWDDSANLFILDEGEHQEDKKRQGKQYLGFCLEAQPQTGATDEMEKILQALHLQAPPNSSISIHIYGSPNVLPTLKNMARNRYQDATLGLSKDPHEKRNINIYQKMARKRIDYYLNGTNKPLFPNSQNILIRDFRVVISVVLPLNPKKMEKVQEAINIREQLKSTLVSAKLPAFEWKPDHLVNFVADFLDHSRMFHIPSRIEKEYEPMEKLRSQIVGREVETTIKSNKIESRNSDSKDQTHLMQFSVTQYPKHFHLARMSSVIGDFFQGELSYPCPFMITTSAIVQDPDKMEQRTRFKNANAQRKLEGYMKKIDPLLKDEAAEWEEAVKSVDNGGSLIQMMTNITLVAPSKYATKARSDVMNLWRGKGFRLSSDKYQQLISFMASMPMTITPAFTSDLTKMNRFSTKYTQNAISFSPLLGEWKGTQNPVMTFVGRRGQLVTLDLFDNVQGGYNFCVVGGTGSGKSFFVQELLMSYRANQARIWIIDVGRSYENLCDILDGDFMEFSKESNICINPFTALATLEGADEKDKEDVYTMLRTVVMTMMSPNEELDSWRTSKISQAIKEVYLHVGKNMTITDVAEYFLNGGSVKDDIPRKDRDRRLCDMGDMLFEWTRNGSVGHYFDGEANIKFDNPFTVLELEELKGKKDLQAVVLMIMMFHITQSMYLSRDGSKSIVFLDEAWEVLSGRNQATADFIEAGYRRSRKYGGAFGTATQNYGDYYKSPAAEAALQNADWRFTLRQNDESIDALEERGLLGIKNNAFRKRTLTSLEKIDGMYSEIFISSPMGSGVVRLLADPYSSFLYSSKSDHFARIRQYKKEGHPTGIAVELTMRDFGIQELPPITYQ